jgi:tetratricopeptide (TPR) repeat protein
MTRSYQQGDEPVAGSGYRLVTFLGRGGFGEVWKASAPGGAEAALKIIKLGGSEGRKEFRALQLVKRIRHPNLVPIIAFWLKSADGSILDDALTEQRDLPLGETAPGALRETMLPGPDVLGIQATELIIAMGLGDGSLFDRLQECRQQGLEGIPAEELLGYLEDVAEAIDFLNSPVHDLGSGPVAIQHCDIKPHNLMIVGGAAQVCDFGLARMMGAERTTTAAATLAYAAPECLVEGKPSATTDQYALAVSYFELKTGTLPYHDETLAAVMDAKRQGNLDFSPVPAAEQAVLRRATSQNPGARYASTSEMVQVLRLVSAGLAATTEYAGGAEEAAPRRRTPALLKMLLILVVVGAGGYVAALKTGYLDGWRPPQPQNGPVLDPAADAFQRAEQHARQNEFGLAIDDYTTAIQLDPKQSKAYLGRGTCYLRLGRLGEAIADFQQLDPRQPEVRGELAEAYFQRAGTYFDESDVGKAMADYEKVVQVEPKYGKAYLGLARCCLKQNDYDKAIAELQEAKQWLSPQALTPGPEFAEAYLRRGLARQEHHDLDGAIADFVEAVRLDPENRLGYQSRKEYAEPYLERGTQLLKEGQYDRATADLEQAGKHNPGDARIFSRQGFAWYRQQRWDKAVESYTAAINVDPNDRDYVSRGQSQLKLGKRKEAIADFSEAIRLNPQNAGAFFDRGRAAVDAEDWAEDWDAAIDDYDAAIKIWGKNPDANSDLVNAYLQRASAYLQRASAHLSADHLDEAVADFNQVLQRGSPEDLALLPPALATLAAQYAEQGKFPQAAQWAKKAGELESDAEKKQKYQEQAKEYEAGKK